MVRQHLARIGAKDYGDQVENLHASAGQIHLAFLGASWLNSAKVPDLACPN
jgi:hypothetical protein